MSDALVILGAAGIVIPVFARFRITPVIGFILVGLLVGPFGLGRLVSESSVALSTSRSPTRGGSSRSPSSASSCCCSPSGWSCRSTACGRCAGWCSGSARWSCCVIAGAARRRASSCMGQHWTGALGARPRAGAVLDRAGAADRRHQHPGRPRRAVDAAVRGHRARADHLPARRAGALCRQATGWSGLVDTLWQGVLVVVGACWWSGASLLPRLFAQAARTKSPELFLAASLLVVIGASLATARGRPLADRRRADRRAADRRDRISRRGRGDHRAVQGPRARRVPDHRRHEHRPARGLGEPRHDRCWRWSACWLLKALVTGVLLRLMGARRGTATETGMLMASPSRNHADRARRRHQRRS